MVAAQINQLIFKHETEIIKMIIDDIPKELVNLFRKGTVIPAQPLALNKDRTMDIKHQKALTRYYIDAGVGGIACGVHSTQFEIRDPQYSLFEKVLNIVSETIDNFCEKRNKKVLKIAGVCGKTKQAIYESEFAVSAGYHASLLSLSAFKNSSIKEMLEHCRKVAEVIPIIGFYLQPAVGGRTLPYEFWCEFSKIPNVLGIKMAPFNRYQTLDVVRGVCDAGMEEEVTLYTGNDDNIIIDLLTEHKIHTKSGEKTVNIKGGLLGHFCCWTKKAVDLLEEIQALKINNLDVPKELLTRAIQVTDCNAAFFDSANNFSGCIPGIHEVLRRQGLLEGTWCLNENEILSKGQANEITRVTKSYPHLHDNEFVKNNLDQWFD